MFLFLKGALEILVGSLQCKHLYAKSHVTPDYQQRERDTEPGGSGRDVPGSADSHKFHLH